MMFSLRLARFIHTGRNCLAAEKSVLAALRKKTGYTFANCKKALEMHNNDLAQAEKWLKEQAQALGWSKAMKLEGRQTSQGLIGVLVQENNGAIIEINCETDFVARNEKFQDIVEIAVKACLEFGSRQPIQRSPVTKVGLNHEQLKALKANDGKSLSDHMALLIGTVGENATLRRAICYKTDSGIYLSGYSHPTSTYKSVMLGRFGALLAYKPIESKTETTETIGRQLCQHIVGMNPTKLGSMEIDKPSKNADDEKCLIYQDFVLDDSLKVQQVLTNNGIEIMEFTRFECGEQDDIVTVESLENVKTCQ